LKAWDLLLFVDLDSCVDVIFEQGSFISVFNSFDVAHSFSHADAEMSLLESAIIVLFLKD
jgi:hypothetical protein